ncbi:NAD(P)H-dependent glycerol-3-phosphate dehydrogenase [Peptococcaceae bacterium 1198_IL3148]
MQQSIAVIGAGSWATALAVQLARNGHNVKMWARNNDTVNDINRNRQNKNYLPGVTIPNNVRCSNDIGDVLIDTNAVLFGVPSHSFREVIKMAQPMIPQNGLVINVAKGIEENTLKRMSEVFIEETSEADGDRYVVLSGPSHAEEVGQDLPTAVVVASRSAKAAKYVQKLFMSGSMRVYTNPDVIGVELGGALKNIIALSTGVADGLGFGDNAKAALMTRGLAEISRLGVAMGALPLTFAGLAGVGDLIVTCTSMHSRNRRAGIEIGKGKTLAEAVETVRMVVEGVRTTKAAKALAAKYQVEMPITEETYRVLFEDFSAREGVMNLMGRSGKAEIEEAAMLKWHH